MRIRRVAIKAFRCIETADVELGRGLNVLYGPNDHGKSTLALALRAALLLPPGGADAQNFRSWFDDQAPSVDVVFEDDDTKVWRVSKTFGSGARAVLDFSKDGITYLNDCTARKVDERLREILGWGIPAPGGKGAPRGFPTSFLSQVLLAEQTNVIAVLDSTLENDPDESGRIRLTKALKGLAQDPLFKRILDEAQASCDRYYTAAGQKKRGKTSPFAEAADETKGFVARLEEKQKQLHDSQAAEAAALTHRERLVELMAARDVARAQLAGVREAHKRQQEFDGATVLVEQARGAVDRILADRARADAKTAEVAGFREAAGRHESEVKRLIGKRGEAAEAARQADEAHRLATSEDAERERKLKKAQLEKQQAELASKMQQVSQGRERAKSALAAQQDLGDAERSHRKAADRFEAAKAAQTKQLNSRTTEEELLQRADAVVAFGRWRTATAALESARQRREEAQVLRKCSPHPVWCSGAQCFNVVSH